MFNLFASRKISAIEIVKPGKGLIQRMGELIALRQRQLDALGDSHGDVDMRLVEKVGAVLDPILGPEGCGDKDAWFHSMDFYGDGVRHLAFKPGKFPMHSIPELQSLLTGEHEPFSVLCWAPPEGAPPSENEQGLVIFSDKLLLTAKLASASFLVRAELATDV